MYFSKYLQTAEVINVCQKSDELNTSNCRHLLNFSKHFFEKSSCSTDQSLVEHSLPLSLVSLQAGLWLSGRDEYWRKDLLNNHQIGALLMNLNKAFNCMSHDRLVVKCKAYGFQTFSISLNEYTSQSIQMTTLFLLHLQIPPL